MQSLSLRVLLIATPLLLFDLNAQASMPIRSKGFTENRGQIKNQYQGPNHEVLYYLVSNGLSVSLRANGFSYQVLQKVAGAEQVDLAAKPLTPELETTWRYN